MKIDHYFWINSDWAYLGMDRLLEIGKRHAVTVDHKPVDLLQIYRRTGGIPLQQRSAERQAYRELELRRWTRRLGIPVNVTPKHMCPDGTMASCFVIAAKNLGYSVSGLSKRIMASEWCEDRDISNGDVLLDITRMEGLPAEEIAGRARDPGTIKVLQDYTDEAVRNGVFGSPSYVFDGDLFWGQDRLNFLDEVVARKIIK